MKIPSAPADQVVVLDERSQLWLWRDVLGTNHAVAAFLRLRGELPWSQPRIRVFGRWHRVPRLQSWHGDPDARYRYASLAMEPAAWHPSLLAIRQRLSELSGCHFNSVLANLYRDGNDRMGWHADDEPELGPSPWIASYSLGEPRRFTLRRKDDHRQKHTLCLGHDDLLLMSPGVQHHWQHALPASRRVTAARINLTFRQIGNVGHD